MRTTDASVIPAKAGIQCFLAAPEGRNKPWMPASAGMTRPS
jgi:hypothetical protein